jgi:hypothetical protein
MLDGGSNRGLAMPKKKNADDDDMPRLFIPKNATLKQIYAICRERFTAADLQKFTEIEPLVPGLQVLAELEEIHREETGRRKRR